MYTILMREDKSLVCTRRTTLYQREKLADKLEFLIPKEYEDIDITKCIILLKYLDQGNVAQSEQLIKDNELYKEKYIRCVLPVDTKITRFAGDINLHLTFIFVNTETLEQDIVMHSGEISITINPLKDMYAHVTDESLEILDKKIIELQASIDAANILNEAIDRDKADDIAYEDNTIQLMSNGRRIGTSHVLDQQKEVEVIDFDNPNNFGSEEEHDDSHEIVEF